MRQTQSQHYPKQRKPGSNPIKVRNEDRATHYPLFNMAPEALAGAVREELEINK